MVYAGSTHLLHFSVIFNYTYYNYYCMGLTIVWDYIINHTYIFQNLCYEIGIGILFHLNTYINLRFTLLRVVYCIISYFLFRYIQNVIRTDYFFMNSIHNLTHIRIDFITYLTVRLFLYKNDNI